MAVSAERAVKYLQSLGVDCKDAKVIDLRARAPLSLASKFSAVTTIADGEAVAVCGYLGQSTDPAELAHDVRTLSEVLDAKIVLALKSVEKPIADALRQEKVNFLVPGRLAYIPPRVVLLPDGAYAAEAPELFKKLLPWTQVVLLNHLLKDGAERRIPFARIKDDLKLNHVYLSRAAAELERRDLARVTYEKTRAFLEFAQDRRMLWQLARDVLSSPSRRTIRLKRRPQGAPYAGISALSRCSDLSDDAEPTFAMTSAAAKGIPESAKCRLGGVKVELWRYDPGILSAEGECVDPLSLCLSLADEAKSDPRVEAEVAKVLENVLC